MYTQLLSTLACIHSLMAQQTPQARMQKAFEALLYDPYAVQSTKEVARMMAERLAKVM